MATTRLEERLLASLGKLEVAPVCFEAVQDVPSGGVLCALPALLALGLLRHSQKNFSLPAGYYPLATIFLVIAFLALARVKSLERLRYEPPGEWGKLLGLDRIPEVRTLREKLQILCQDGQKVGEWSHTLAQEWMEADPQSAGTLYIDGHVRVYHGHLTELPRRYVARQQAADPGLLKVLEEQIVPRLLREVPGQPSEAELAANPRRCRFTLIFDRAGYSPEFFARMWALRIAVITYHKFPKEPWAEEEFSSCQVRLINGEEVQLSLAERGVCLSNGFWMRELRQRESSGHQTSMLCSDYPRQLSAAAAALFARWCQENFFQYMGQHYGLDRLIEYGTQGLPETTVVVNPAWRQKDQAVRRERALLVRQQVRFAALSLTPEASPEVVAQFEQQKGKLLEQIQHHQSALDELKAQRKENAKHLALKDLPEKERFNQLTPTKKQFVDTIKLIAYRAETALVQVVREKLQREDDARALVRQIFGSTVDLCPDQQQKTLTVRLHRLSTSAHDEILSHLCAELTASETTFPGTELRLVFEPIGTSQLPRDQES